MYSNNAKWRSLAKEKDNFLIHFLCPEGINVKYLLFMIEKRRKVKETAKLTFIAIERTQQKILYKNGTMSAIRITEKNAKVLLLCKYWGEKNV